jgi:hypothetical protein
MSTPTPPLRLLAIDPISRGFGFAVLEGPTALVDWGIRHGANDPRAFLRRVRALIALYRPDVIVVEDCRDHGSRRRQRVRKVLQNLARLASAETEFCVISASVVRRIFGAGAVVTKHAVATAVAEHFPELAFRLPPKRKAWMTEDARMSIFGAVAFALTYYCVQADVSERAHAPWSSSSTSAAYGGP